jgi:hypothetical protein
LGATIKCLRCATSGVADGGLGKTIKFLRSAAETGLGTTIKFLRAAAGIGLGTTFKYLRRSTSGAAGNGCFGKNHTNRESTSERACLSCRR